MSDKPDVPPPPGPPSIPMDAEFERIWALMGVELAERLRKRLEGMAKG